MICSNNSTLCENCCDLTRLKKSFFQFPWKYVSLIFFFLGSVLWLVGPCICFVDEESFHCQQTQLAVRQVYLFNVVDLIIKAAIMFFIYGSVVIIEILVSNNNYSHTGT